MEGLLHPLNTVCTVMKANSTSYTTFGNQIKSMYKYEGMKSYFKGFSCTFVSSFACNGFYFYTYEQLKSLFKSRKVVQEQFVPFLAGFAAGFTCDFAYMPFDCVRARMQASNGTYNYRNVFDGLSKMWKKERMSSLRNCGPLYFALSGLQTSLTFGFYEIFQKLYKPFLPSQYEVNVPLTIASSVSAASLASCLGNPLDVLVTRKQMSTSKISTWDLARNIYKNEGCKGFMKGVSGTVSYYALASAILFPTYEILKNTFNVDLSDE
jgi:solute carrier family 25 thiamine pyrophosphate transporter 19